MPQLSRNEDASIENCKATFKKEISLVIHRPMKKYAMLQMWSNGFFGWETYLSIRLTQLTHYAHHTRTRITCKLDPTICTKSRQWTYGAQMPELNERNSWCTGAEARPRTRVAWLPKPAPATWAEARSLEQWFHSFCTAFFLFTYFIMCL
jgi:hypothetical protein